MVELKPRVCVCPLHEVFTPTRVDQIHAFDSACRKRAERARKRDSTLSDESEHDKLTLPSSRKTVTDLQRVNLPRTTDEVLRRPRIVVPVEKLIDLGGADGLDWVEMARKRVVLARVVIPQMRDSLLNALWEDMVEDLERSVERLGPDLEVLRRRQLIGYVAAAMAQAVVSRKGRPPQLHG